MMQKSYQQDWEELGENDPLWAILSRNDKRFGKWNIEEFFKTADRDMRRLRLIMHNLQLPGERLHALDFGCGVGRLTRALAHSFDHVTGVDISGTMIERARVLNRDFLKLDFVHNTAGHLKCFDDDKFDLIYTLLVLQHVSSQDLIRAYITEFLRILKPGGLLIFQLPSRIGLKTRINPRRHLYIALRSVGVPAPVLMEKFKLSPINMRHLPVSEVIALVEGRGGRLVGKRTKMDPTLAYQSTTYYVTKG